MAEDEEEVSIGRIIACFAPGGAGAGAVARLARETQVELLGLFIEDVALLRFASLPFAAEVGFPSAVRRAVDLAGLERQLRAQQDALRRELELVLGPPGAPWSFRVARASPVNAVEAALAEGHAPALLVPPGTDPRGARRVVRRREVSGESLRAMLQALRPVLIVPE